ncbi:MAG: hypothetical protein ACSHYF_15520 [Verrucomicrobiaceae bacterium]
MNPLDHLGQLLDQDDCQKLTLGIAEANDQFDVVTLFSPNDDPLDAFPLPLDLQSALTQVAEDHSLPPTWLHASTSMILEPQQLPSDFFDDQKTQHFGSSLEVRFLGRSARKYLHLFHAVHRADDAHLTLLQSLNLAPLELLKATQWIRTENLLAHTHGDRLTFVLETLSP